MFVGRRYIIPLFFLFLFTVQCRNDNVSKDVDLNQQEETKVGTVYSVDLLDLPGLQNLISQRNGRVLFINVWATWCIPCREEFPDLVRLTNTFQDRPVEIIAISADYPDEIDSKVIPFLESQRVNFPVYVQNFAGQEDFINFLNRGWSGALPASFIYNTGGEQKSFLLGKQSYQELVNALENEL